MLGVIQEQHPERCRLFAQWKQFEWPIVYDPINRLGLRAVPIVMAIDEHGVVRQTRPRQNQIDAFLETSFKPPAKPARRARVADAAVLARQAQDIDSADAWMQLGDHRLLWSPRSELPRAIEAYQQALRKAPKDPRLHFRLGVALRMRYDAAKPVAGDFQAAVRHWDRALELNPNQYIYRRRIQQFGPRLIKPYPFYDWVAQARREIRQRGEQPIRLRVEPGGAEIARPARQVAAAAAAKQPDPQGKIQRDLQKWIASETVVVPSKIRPGRAARLHLTFRPRGAAHWNNEAEPFRVWLEAPDGWTLSHRLRAAPQPRAAESREARTLEWEIRAPAVPQAKAELRGYAVYYVCEEEGGQCLFLRQDLRIPLPLDQPR